MSTQTIGKKEAVEPENLNVLNRRKPNSLLRDEDQSFFIQNGRVFSLNGYFLVGPESSKKDIWNLMQTPLGLEAVKLVNLEVTLADVSGEKHADGAIFNCEVCSQSFPAGESLMIHKRIHAEPKGMKKKKNV